MNLSLNSLSFDIKKYEERLHNCIIIENQISDAFPGWRKLIIGHQATMTQLLGKFLKCCNSYSITLLDYESEKSAKNNKGIF